MSTPVAVLLFVVGLAASLGASEMLVRGLGRLGSKLGLAAGLIGLLTALGADAPEISSAVTALLSGAKDVGLGVILGSNLFNIAALLGFSTLVAGRIVFHRPLLWLDGGVALWATVVIGLVFFVKLAPALSLALVLAVFLIYVFLLATPPHRAEALALPPRMRHRLAAAARLIHMDLERSEKVALAEHGHADAPGAPSWMVVPAVAVIVAGSVAMVNGALALGSRWHIPQAILGAVVLAVITSLPNAYAATRLALLGNGTAVISLAFNSNTLNLLAGVSIPAVVIGGLNASAAAAIAISWLLAMTLLAIGLGWLQGGLNRLSGVLLIVVYLLFIVFALR